MGEKICKKNFNLKFFGGKMLNQKVRRGKWTLEKTNKGTNYTRGPL